jgi:hypothetical protein
MLEIIDELRRVEESKQQVPVGSPEFVTVAKRAEELSRLAFRWAQMQLQMALDANNRIAAGNLPAETRLITVEAPAARSRPGQLARGAVSPRDLPARVA